MQVFIQVFAYKWSQKDKEKQDFPQHPNYQRFLFMCQHLCKNFITFLIRLP